MINDGEWEPLFSPPSYLPPVSPHHLARLVGQHDERPGADLLGDSLIRASRLRLG